MSDLRMDVQPYGDGRVLLTLGSLSLTLDAAARDKLRELLDRAAMPGQSQECPIEAVLPDGHHPCTLKRGHDGKHDFADEGTWHDA